MVLKRLDLNGAPHRNPHDQIIPCPHMHTYREGYGDKWAEPVSAGKFITECNVVQAPSIQTGLF